MPTLKTLRQVHKEWKEAHPEAKPFKSIPVQERTRLYNSKEWKTLTRLLKQERPLCLLCLIEDILSPSEDSHHLIKFNDLNNASLRTQLLLDLNNIICLCKRCHHSIHENPENLSLRQRDTLQSMKDTLYNDYIDKGYNIKYTTDLNNYYILERDLYK